MKLINTSIFSAVITFIRIASGFIAGKLIAIITGATGVAIVGAFTNFITIVLTVGNGAINNGVVKYGAEYQSDEAKQKRLISTSFKITIWCSVSVGIVILILANFISVLILNDIKYVNVIRTLGITVIFYSLNTLIISLLNGQGNIKKYALVNAAGSITGLLLTVVLVLAFKIKGALYSLVLAQAIVFFITLIILRKSDLFSRNNLQLKFDREIGLKLGHYSLMAIVSALTVPVSQIILRNMLIDKLGFDFAGYWQGMMRVSDGYLMIITTSLSTYYLPKLSTLQSDHDIRKEVFKGYNIILPTVLIGCVIIYLLRFFIIKVLYTPDFIEMESLFLWQLVGDFFKMTAWVLAFLMLAKSKTSFYIFTEIGFSALFILLGYVCVSYFGLKGITIAFAINYFLYMSILIFFFRKLLFNKIK